MGSRKIIDKLFFYTNYEAFRSRQNALQDNTILTASAAQGIFTYVDKGGALHQVNILQVSGNKIDPIMQAMINQIPAPNQG